MKEKTWRTIDFRPAPAGWRAIGLSEDEDGRGWYSLALPGWLIQEECRYAGAAMDEPAEDRDRRIVAAFDENGRLWEADESMTDFWYVVGPGDPDPSQEEATRERACRERNAQAARERAAS